VEVFAELLHRLGLVEVLAQEFRGEVDAEIAFGGGALLAALQHQEVELQPRAAELQ
jgi:hypothetical protein